MRRDSVEKGIQEMSEINQILFDYAEAEKQAAQLEQLAEKLANLSTSDMEKILSDIDSAWKGDNATSFLQKGSTIQNKINTSAGELKKIAETIRAISNNLHKADEEAVVLVSGK